jgi:hypothetical protein
MRQAAITISQAAISPVPPPKRATPSDPVRTWSELVREILPNSCG